MLCRLGIFVILLASVLHLNVRGDPVDQTAGTGRCRPDDFRDDDDSVFLQAVGDRSHRTGKAHVHSDGTRSEKKTMLHTVRTDHGEAADTPTRARMQKPFNDGQNRTDADVSLAQRSLPSQNFSLSTVRDKPIQEFKDPLQSIHSRLGEAAAHLESSLLLRARIAKRAGEKYLANARDTGSVFPFLTAAVLVVICVIACVYTCSTPVFLEPRGHAEIRRSAQDMSRATPALISRRRIRSAACLVPPVPTFDNGDLVKDTLYEGAAGTDRERDSGRRT